MDELLAQAARLAERIREDRRWLHAHAETGFALHDTADYVSRQLKEMGLAPKKCGRCGVLAEVGQGDRCVLLRADMDALPIREEADVPFACGSGAMHACGHDLHTAMLLGAARLLKAREKALPGRVLLMFQPAEELLQGAQDMLTHGLLDGGVPEAAFMIHVLTGLDIPVGTVIVSAPGVSAPMAEMFAIRIQGKGCHGAMPHTGIDPVSVGAHIVQSLMQISTRELSLTQSHALTIASFQAGNTANVIPDDALLRGSFRAFDDKDGAFIRKRIGEIAAGTAAVFGASAQVETLGGCPTLMNDPQLSRAVHASLSRLLPSGQVLLSGELGGDGAKSSGSEDFAAISHAMPSLMAALAAGRPQDGCAWPAHHPRTTFDESALPTGAAVYAAMALAALK